MSSKFQPGQSGNPHGRKPGTPNKLTKTVRTVFEEVFAKLQEDESPAKLDTWAKKNPRDFYQLASKLIPTQVQAQVEDVTPYSDTQAAAKLASIMALAEARRTRQHEDGEDNGDLA